MQFDIFNLFSNTSSKPEEEKQISFSKYIAHLENRKKEEQSALTRFYNYLLMYFENHPELKQPVDLTTLSAHKELLELMAISLFPILDDDTELFRAFSLPYSGTVFYSSDAFFDHLSPNGPAGNMPVRTPQEKTLFIEKINELKYAQILKEVYGIQSYAKDKMVHVCEGERSGLQRYYSIQVDSRFVSVIKKKKGPHEDIPNLQTRARKVNKYCELEGYVPLDDFIFEGFAILTAKDITVEHAVHKMRSAIISHSMNNYALLFKEILHQLQVLSGTKEIEFGLQPLARLDNRLVSFYHLNTHSILIRTFREQGKTEEEFLSWIEAFLKKPHFIFFKKGEDSTKNDEVLSEVFSCTDMEAYGLLPIFHNNEVTGILEAGSRNAELLTHNHMASVDTALPVLSQFLYTTSINFQFKIDAVIRKYFTSLQPAVQWKFNRAALQILQAGFEKGSLPETQFHIRFEKVQPLYGAIDIRNSTIERNNALYTDIKMYFSLLQSLLEQLLPDDKNAVEKWLADARALQQNDTPYFYSNNEEHIQIFFRKVCGFLQTFTREHPGKKELIEQYYKDTDASTGIAYSNRRKLESAMQMINGLLNTSLDAFHEEIDNVFPCYFDRFRTDGVEYDIYIGQSLTPQQSYNENQHLRKLRYLQLRNMISLIKQTKSLLPALPVALQTTQLIYVNANPIDITFRMDEKRFDTEGSYNIRYQIIKKRIDKVHVRHTEERLTQPGKIAIVYSRQEDETEYVQHLQRLEKEGLLTEEIEYLQLEELQGIDGLQALRVSIIPGYK